MVTNIKFYLCNKHHVFINLVIVILCTQNQLTFQFLIYTDIQLTIPLKGLVLSKSKLNPRRRQCPARLKEPYTINLTLIPILTFMGEHKS